ncbi:MAG: hypothetical protein ACLUVY_05210 [Bacteroides uniformis]
MSEEKFIKEGLPFVSNLKLRASYGKSGYDAGDPFQYVAAYTQGEKGYVFNDKLTMGMVAPGVVLDNLSCGFVTKTADYRVVDLDLLEMVNCSVLSKFIVVSAMVSWQAASWIFRNHIRSPASRKKTLTRRKHRF